MSPSRTKFDRKIHDFTSSTMYFNREKLSKHVVLHCIVLTLFLRSSLSLCLSRSLSYFSSRIVLFSHAISRSRVVLLSRFHIVFYFCFLVWCYSLFLCVRVITFVFFLVLSESLTFTLSLSLSSSSSLFVSRSLELFLELFKNLMHKRSHNLFCTCSPSHILIYLSCLWIQSSKEESAYDSCTLSQLSQYIIYAFHFNAWRE